MSRRLKAKDRQTAFITNDWVPQVPDFGTWESTTLNLVTCLSRTPRAVRSPSVPQSKTTQFLRFPASRSRNVYNSTKAILRASTRVREPRVTVDLAQLLGEFILCTYVEVVVARLPKRLLGTAQRDR